ncbi:MAG: efflux RND transporter permease subunit [Gemmatimonadetes bacterium]|nr:efflux RND transporter permease subunit [Gemmatimonadota bacterium]MCY3679340.1 efflux RND transporter permease subunit [Gemmatimonadota bacterium]MYA41235.1 efflux RND transporter permease subunit [Gemmatimonadota bacterium]MYE93064.1 efflux RND transporter permease subunit [Gemmatimonadota bacterium]MYJ09531.1 efflux RND transporter permease subunit [Gemmatimonadota bacterium]
MKNGLIAYFAGNPVAANLLMLFFIVGGLIAGSNLPVQNFPEIDLRSVTVSVKSPGSSPREVREDIVRRLEENVIGLPGVERVVAAAYEGLAQVTVELATFADAAAVLDDVKNAVDRIENFPPVSAEQPEIEYSRVEIEVLTLSVSSASATENELRLAAQALREGLLELPSVSQVTLLGTRDREISIELSEVELRRNGLSINQITDAIRRASLNLTFGELRTDAGGLVLHTVSKRQFGDEFEDIPVITRLDGSILTVGEVAEIRDGFVDEDIITRVDGDPAILVRVDATGQQSIVTMGEDIRSWLSSYQPPPNVEIGIWSDRAGDAVDTISSIVGNAVVGTILVLLCLVVFFDLRVATWVTLGIPLSFLGSLIFFGMSDLTLNLGTIFAFFLMVGIVVDDAVVVGDSIAAEREGGKEALEAAVSGARAMVGPITIGAVTTMLAFIPLLFITPPRLQIVNVFPYVAFFVLTVSLIEAFFILPAHLSHPGRWSRPPLSDIQHRAHVRLQTLRDMVVVPAVSWSIRHLWFAPVLGTLLVLFALLLLRANVVRVVYFDEVLNASENIQADLTLPVGTPFEVTLAAAERFSDAALAVNDQSEGTSVEAVSIMAGNLLSRRTAEAGPNRSHLASVVVHLNERPIRRTSVLGVTRQWRENIGDVSYLQGVAYYTQRTQSESGVAYALKHDDLDSLRAATNELTASMASMPGMYGISDNLVLGKRQFEIELTPTGKAAGLTPAGIGVQLRASFHGAEVQRIQRGHDEIKVMVRYPRERRQSMRELASERIHRPGTGENRASEAPPASGGEVPLSTVADLSERRELATLVSIDGQQTALVSAEADPALLTPLQARRQINESVVPELLERYRNLRIQPHGSARTEGNLLGTLAVLVPLLLIAMYVLIAAFLRSYWKPVIAVVGIPIAFSGAVVSHWILGWDFSAMSLFGVIGVAGVIVNDALVLMDRYNVLRRESSMLPAIAAASAATRHRFRAVFLTSLTTILALAPLLYVRSEELMILVPFVVSMLGGLVFSGFFILYLLPSLVMIAEARAE